MISPDLLVNALNAIIDGVVITEAELVNNQRKIVYVNPAFEQLSGYQRHELIGKDCRFLNKDCRNQIELILIKNALASKKSCRVTILNHRKNGEPFWNELNISPLFDKHRVITHFVGIQKDVSERVEREKFIQHQQALLTDTNNELKAMMHQNVALEELATHDPLTKLYNRLNFEKKLTHLWMLHSRLKAKLCMAFIDIDSFKAYNDCYGHLQGDQALRAVADMLRHNFSRDHEVIARIGGEEFLVISSMTEDINIFENQIEKLRIDVYQLCISHQQSRTGPYLTISIGIYVDTPSMNNSPEFFIKKADEAMYMAKNKGGNCFIRLG